MKYGVGQAVRRKEDVRLVTGRGQYIDDLHLEATVFACFVRSPHAHAVIRSVDISTVRSMPGVIGAITAKDVAATGYVPVRGAFKNRDGSAMHQFYASTMQANEGDSREHPERPSYYGDAHLWIVLAVCSYLKETGDLGFLQQRHRSHLRAWR